MRTFKRILGVLLIFFFGVVVGSVVTGAGAMQRLRDTLAGGSDAVMDVIVRRLDRELKLDEEQKRKLQGIVDDAHIQLRQSQAKIQPEVELTLHEAEERTRAILYPQQIKKFDDMVAKSREKWKASRTAAPAAPAVTPAPATPDPSAKSQEPSNGPSGNETPSPAGDK